MAGDGKFGGSASVGGDVSIRGEVAVGGGMALGKGLTMDDGQTALWRGQMTFRKANVEVTADSCTSTLAAVPNTATATDTVNCVLSGTGDFGATPGACADTASAVATCAYVPGAYSSVGPSSVTAQVQRRTGDMRMNGLSVGQ